MKAEQEDLDQERPQPHPIPTPWECHLHLGPLEHTRKELMGDLCLLDLYLDMEPWNGLGWGDLKAHPSPQGHLLLPQVVSKLAWDLPGWGTHRIHENQLNFRAFCCSYLLVKALADGKLRGDPKSHHRGQKLCPTSSPA